MDYKEKYDKLVEAVKALQEANPSDGGIQNWVNDNVPELKESKDERVRKDIRQCIKLCSFVPSNGTTKDEMFAWLEKQGKCETDCPQNHQDVNHPNGCITMEDFSGGEGFYKLHLDYLSKKQVEEVEEMVKMWNKGLKASNENIKACIGMCLTDVDEQRFKDYDTSLEECLAWLEKSKSTAIDIDKMVDEFEHSKVISRGIPSLTEVDAYRKGVTDALSKILIGEEKDC